MPFLVASMKRSKSGAYTARKVIPKDVRAEYQRLYDRGWEEKFSQPAGMRQQDAKARHTEWLSEIEARIAAIRAQQRGEGQSLTQREARALAGEWYRWFIAQYEENPGLPERWDGRFETFVFELERYAPKSAKVAPWKDLDWARTPKVRAGIRPALAEETRAQQFLASKGLMLTKEAYALFLDFVLDDYLAAMLLLEKRAHGDYAPDERLQQLPAFDAAPNPRHEASGITPWELFQAWVDTRKPAASSVDRWRSVFLHLKKHFDGRVAGSITSEEAQAWADGLVTANRSARTVNEIWCNAANAVFGLGVSTKKISSNPFKDVKVTVPKKVRTRERTFTSEEIKLILGSALAISDTRRVSKAACRWVPWICAYSGARAGEITQLRGEDVFQRDGYWVIRITPEAGTVKTNEARTIPLHAHLFEQGFIDYVLSKGKAPLFYNNESPSKIKASESTNPPKSRSVKQREHVAAWVRRIGVTDKAVAPNHAWRHTFKQIADRAGISEKMSDTITGHAPASVGRSYGVPTVGDMADALKKFPRYDVGQVRDGGELVDTKPRAIGIAAE